MAAEKEDPWRHFGRVLMILLELEFGYMVCVWLVEVRSTEREVKAASCESDDASNSLGPRKACALFLPIASRHFERLWLVKLGY